MIKWFSFHEQIFKKVLMRKIHWAKYKKYKELKKPKISYICDKKLLLSSISIWKCGKEDEKIFKEEESIEALKFLDLINNIEEYQKTLIMPEENVSQDFRMKNIDKTKNYLVEKINQSKLMSKKHKKVYRVFNYIKSLLLLISAVSGCIFNSAFGSLVGTPMGITSSSIGLKICAITAGIKK